MNTVSYSIAGITTTSYAVAKELETKLHTVARTILTPIDERTEEMKEYQKRIAKNHKEYYKNKKVGKKTKIYTK